MAAKAKIFLLFASILLNIFVVTVSQNTTSQPATTAATQQITTPPTPQSTAFERNTDLAECTCDLTASACDVNCCCDPECDENDRAAFSQCIDEYTGVDDRVCFQSNVILINNSPYTSETTQDGLFCIHKDNYADRNYLYIPDIVNTTEKFEEYVAEYGGPSFKPENVEDKISTEYYKSGDPIYTVFESEALGKLGQPAPITTRECTDQNPAAFLYSRDLECVRAITDLALDCMTQPYLDAVNFYANFRVVRNPADLITPPDDNITNTVPPSNFTTTFDDVVTTPSDTTDDPVTDLPTTDTDSLYNISIIIDASGPHICIDEDGLNTTCSTVQSPSYDLGTGVCSYMMIKTKYTILHNSTAGLDSVSVQFTFQNIRASGSLALTQSYETEFAKTDEGDTFRRSGNPGYRYGEPVMAGKRVEIVDIDGQVTYAIELDSDRSNWMTIITAQLDGGCGNDTDSRASVTFGDDMRSGCNIRAQLSNYTDSCSVLQTMALSALRGFDNSEAKYVATFGNSAVETVGDWVEVLDPVADIPDAVPSGSTTCRDLVTGMHIEFLFANVGALGNPQAKIIGVKYYYQTQNVQFQCIGPYCQPDNYDYTQTIEVVSSVGFVDVSERAIDVSGEKPQITARLPEDFFYPFT